MTRDKQSWAVAGGLVAALLGCTAAAWFQHWALAELVVTASWGLVVLASFAGWGLVVARVCRQPAGIALRAVWGASLLAFVGGVLALVSLLGSVVLFAFVFGGVAVQIHAWIRERDALWREARLRLRAARLYPAVACVAAFVACGVLLHYLGGAADATSNPYDDDVAYHLFTKQLVERGTLIDPFSFRRMSTLGGQSLFHALLYLRVPIVHVNVFDRGMCVLWAAGLLAAYRVGGRRTPTIARLLGVLFFVALPFDGINTASYYSGVVFFLGLYLSLERLVDSPVRGLGDAVRRTAPLALVGAAACTLRQNYQTEVAFFVIVSYASLIWRRRRSLPVRALWLEALVCVSLVTIFVAPWLALLYRSNQTFLFPIMKGTLRAGVSVQSTLMTKGKLARFFVEVWLTPIPITTFPVFALVGFLVRERSPRIPLTSLWVATFLSIAALSVGFSMADAGNFARYDYGFVTPTALLTWLVVASRLLERRMGWRTVLPAALLAVCMVSTIQKNAGDTRSMIDDKLRNVTELTRRSLPPDDEGSPVAAAYHRLQASVPAGAPILVMLDLPYHLDYRRNPLVNLDMPGMASPAPGIPCFEGPEPVADYIEKLGIRYVAFVESDHSTYLYRREVWFENLYHPDQFWRVIAPYLMNVMDNLADLAKTRVHLADEAGMVVLDLDQRR